MSKNMTRKGLAFGAGLSLVATSIAATIPAFAADMDITALNGSATNFVGLQALTTTAGDENGFVVSTNTGLTGATQIAGGVNASSLTKWLVDIVNPDITWDDIYLDGNFAGNTVPATTKAQSDIQFFVGDSAAFATARNTIGTHVFGVGTAVAPTGTATSFVVDGADGLTNNLRINASFANEGTTTSDTLSLKVTAFLDIDGDNRNDDGRSGSAVTVDLLPVDAPSFTAALNYTPLGATTVTGTVSSSNVNLRNLERLASGLSADSTQDFAVTLVSDIAASAAQSTNMALATTAGTNNTTAGLGVIFGAITAGTPDTIAVSVSEANAAVIPVGALVKFTGVSDLGDNNAVGGAAGAADVPLTTGSVTAKGPAAGGVVILTVSSTADIAANTVGLAANASININTLVYNSTTRAYDFAFSSTQVDLANGGAGAPTAVAAGKLTATFQIDGATATVAAGTGFYKTKANSFTELTVAAATVDNVEIKVTPSSTLAQDTALTGAATVVAVEETKSLTFTAQAWTNAGKTVAAGAGLPVQVTLRDVANGLDTTTISSNSKTLKSTGDNSAFFTLNTDANGRITFTVTADKAVDGELFHIDIAVEGKTDTTVVRWQKEAISLIQSPDGNFVIAPKGSASVDYTVVNQFGQAVANDTYQLVFTRAQTADSTGRDTTAEYASWSYVVPVASGRASVTIVDNGADAKGLDTVTATLQKKATNGGFASTATTDTFTLTYDPAYKTPSLSTAVSNNGVAIGTTSVYPVALEAKTLSNLDTRSGALDPKYADVNAFDNRTDTTADNLLKISGKVLSSTNAGLANVAVKISAKGLNFANAATSATTTVFANDSIVVVTNATGDYQAWIRSAVGGKQTITVEAMGLSKTADVTFAIGTASVASFEVKAPSSSEPGRTADVVVTAKDKAGNAAQGVSVTLSSTGPGYLINTSGTTLSDGTFSTKLLVGSNDTGVATIKVTMTVDGVETSKTATITVGAAEASAKIGSFNGRVAVRVENAKGSTVSVKIGKSWYKYSAISDNYLQSWKSRKGTSVAVSVYVDGELQNVQTITVK